MGPERWSAVDAFLCERLVLSDPALDGALAANQAAGLPAHDVSPPQGKLLHLLARMCAARRILEIGTLGGYSTIWLARALGEDGRLVTIESDPEHARVARSNLERAAVSHLVELRVGRALDVLPLLESEGAGPFDLVFIDADKPNNPDYLRWALRLSRQGTVIVGDNVIREGAVTDPVSADPRVQGARRFLELMADEPALMGTAIQTVGSKGYDGFAVALVL